MSPAPLSGFGEIESLQKVQQVLSGCTHNAFTIEDENHNLVGLVLRSEIVDWVKSKGGVVAANGELNLMEFCNRSPTIVSELTPLEQGYIMFRDLALRHMLIIDKDDANHVVGMLTRKDLIEALEDSAAEYKHSKGRENKTWCHSSSSVSSSPSTVEDNV
mmetsp:Transcript_2690/g.2234  ORF Transcript_2690/g.2234 Transcript_2690/m.2234 type:complete len:160 (-) Transcript_2690:377-856(-)